MTGPLLAQHGTWWWNVATDQIEWSSDLCDIYGVALGGAPADFEAYLGCIHPDDRAAVADTIAAAAAGGSSRFSFKHRIVHPDGAVRVIHSLGEVIADEDGQLLKMQGTALDITDRELMEAELKRSSRHFELSNDLVATANRNGHFTQVNAVWTKTLGWSESELLARPIIEFVHPDDRDATVRELQKLGGSGGSTVGFVNRYVTKQGGWRWLEWNAFGDPEEDHLYASARDVTDRKLADAALAASERHTRQIIDTASNAFVAIDARAIITDWNPRAHATFGWSRDEAVGRDICEMIVPEPLRDAYRRSLTRFLGAPEYGSSQLIELEALHRDGHEFRVELTFSPIETGDGIIFNAFLRDVTQRRRAYEEIERSKTLLADLLDSAPDAVVIADERGAITLVNEQVERLFGYERAELLGTPLENLLPDRVREQHRIRRARYLEDTERKRVDLDLDGCRKDGTEFPISVSFSAIETDPGMLVTAFVRDITERRRTEHELVATHERALQSSRMKSEFVANMSHEIRTPLNGVIGMSGLLLSTELSDEQREYAEAVQASGDALIMVIDDILDFSKIEAGKLELNNASFDVRELVEDACAMLARPASEKDLELMSWIAGDLPDTIFGDGPRVRQVVVNLLTNAVKFTHVGEVVVRVWEQLDDDDRSWLRFEVSDTGIGVERSSQSDIFEAFSQADSSTTRRYGGTGLGLTISKRLISLMGGQIGVKSTPGQGSAFWAMIPYKRPLEQQVTFGPVGLDGVRTIVVDDNATSRGILSRQLTAWGMDCETATDARGALILLENAAQSGHLPRLVVLDSRMPQMGGLELAAVIRADPALRSIALVLLTSPGDGRAKAAQAGVHAIVTKPVREARLCAEITRVLRAPTSASPTGAEVAETSPEPAPEHVDASGSRMVLVAEDKSVNQLVARRLLERRGCQVDVAGDGRQVLEMYRTGRYELIFMDCHMPLLDGYRATAEIRRREGYDRHTPIIAMTASTMKGDRERCIAAGMDDYLGKPLDPAELDTILARRWPTGLPAEGASPPIG